MSEHSICYWVLEFFVIFAADLTAGLILIWRFDAKKERLSKNIRTKQICLALESMAKKEQAWANGVSLVKDQSKLLRCQGAFFGLDLLITNMQNWEFDSSETLMTHAEKLFFDVMSWEQHRNFGDPANYNISALQTYIENVGRSADELIKALSEYKKT